MQVSLQTKILMQLVFKKQKILAVNFFEKMH